MQERYRQAKATKRGERGGAKSQYLIVPLKRGNLYREDPVEGRGCRVTEPWLGTRSGTCPPVACHRNGHG